jgi:hypothetical protein
MREPGSPVLLHLFSPFFWQPGWEFIPQSSGRRCSDRGCTPQLTQSLRQEKLLDVQQLAPVAPRKRCERQRALLAEPAPEAL